MTRIPKNLASAEFQFSPPPENPSVKAKSPSSNRRKPIRLIADRGELPPIQDIAAVLLENITDMNLHPGAADSAGVSDHTHFSRAEAKGIIEKLFANIKFNQENGDENPK